MYMAYDSHLKWAKRKTIAMMMITNKVTRLYSFIQFYRIFFFLINFRPCETLCIFVGFRFSFSLPIMPSIKKRHYSIYYANHSSVKCTSKIFFRYPEKSDLLLSILIIWMKKKSCWINQVDGSFFSALAKIMDRIRSVFLYCICHKESKCWFFVFEQIHGWMMNENDRIWSKK